MFSSSVEWLEHQTNDSVVASSSPGRCALCCNNAILCCETTDMGLVHHMVCVYTQAFAGSKLYCLVTKAHRCEQLAQGQAVADISQFFQRILIEILVSEIVLLYNSDVMFCSRLLQNMTSQL